MRILVTYRVPEPAPLEDALIAAITQAARTTVVTPNTRHFESPRAAFLNQETQNPWRRLVTARHRHRAVSADLAWPSSHFVGPYGGLTWEKYRVEHVASGGFVSFSGR